MEFTPNSILIGIMAAWFAILYFKFRRFTKQLRTQQRRYPMFAARDRLVRMKLDGKISDELFTLAYKFCNNAMCVSDEVDLIDLAVAMSKIAKASKSRFSELALDQSKRDPEFAALYVETISHVIKWGAYNSLFKRPLPLMSLVIHGTAKNLWADFKQIWRTKRIILSAA